MMGSHTYTSDSIKAYPLSELVRRRPQMYIGNALDEAGLHFIIDSIIEQAIDPMHFNQCTDLSVTLGKESLTIADNGRGLPVDLYTLGNTTAAKLQFLLRIPLSQRPDSIYYQTFGHFDYLFTILSVLSQKITVSTIVDGIQYDVVASLGKIIQPCTNAGQSDKRGTKITVEPDWTAFTCDQFSASKIADSVALLSEKYPHVQLSFSDHR